MLALITDGLFYQFKTEKGLLVYECLDEVETLNFVRRKKKEGFSFLGNLKGIDLNIWK